MLSLLQEELIRAMKAKDKPTLICLRNIMGKLKAYQINNGAKLTSEECIKILNSSVKQLKDSIEQYNRGGRKDLAEKEAFELALIEKYLPEHISENEIRSFVQNAIKSTQEIGWIMGVVMKKLPATVDGKVVKKIVQQELKP